MRRATQGRRGGGAVAALVAALALCFQILVPAVGGTARVLAGGRDAGLAAAAHHRHAHEGAPPGRPAQGHDHLGLCCIIAGGKLGTGFAPPPSAGLAPALRAVRSGAVAYRPVTLRTVQGRTLLPVGARAPPRFA
jgi:hypothetical protein